MSRRTRHGGSCRRGRERRRRGCGRDDRDPGLVTDRSAERRRRARRRDRAPPEALIRPLPGNWGMAEEGPGGAAADAFRRGPFPPTRSRSRRWTPRRARASAAAQSGGRSRAGRAARARGCRIGPSKALYPFEDFRNSFLYVPNAYVAGGRTTAIAIDEHVQPSDCRLYITPAGGGIWRPERALRGNPNWEYLGGPLGINSAGAVTIDPQRPERARRSTSAPARRTSAARAASPASASTSRRTAARRGPARSAARRRTREPVPGQGHRRDRRQARRPEHASTSRPRPRCAACPRSAARASRGRFRAPEVGPVQVDERRRDVELHPQRRPPTRPSAPAPSPSSTTPASARRAACATCSSTRRPEHRSTRPRTHAASGARPTAARRGRRSRRRSTAALIQTRPRSPSPGSAERQDADVRVRGQRRAEPYSRLFRSDDVATRRAGVHRPDEPEHRGDRATRAFNICEPQCWYDIFVHTPKGYPDIVYAGGDYSYGETIANKRAVILSTDAGVSGTDMTLDGDRPAPPERAPSRPARDRHEPEQPAPVLRDERRRRDALERRVRRPLGLVRRPEPRAHRHEPHALPADALADPVAARGSSTTGSRRCSDQGHRSSPHNVNVLQGGTQDNGTWETSGSPVKWENTMIGDGGRNGFDVALPDFRFHSFFDISPEVNFEGGNVATWISVYDPLFGHAGSQFYSPIISDPRVSGTMFAGTGRTAYRTKTHGLGTMTMEEAQEHCNSVDGRLLRRLRRLGASSEPVRLTNAAWGDRAGPAVIARSSGRRPTRRRRGRRRPPAGVFVSKNVDADPASRGHVDTARRRRGDRSEPVRLEHLRQPGERQRGVDLVQRLRGEHAGDCRATCSASSTTRRPGPRRGRTSRTTGATCRSTTSCGTTSPATCTRRATSAPPCSRAARRRGSPLQTGMPAVEVASLEIRPEERILYAATHGLSTWRLNLG